METAEVQDIKKLAIIAMFTADDDLSQQLVLKGGNALDLVYNSTGRSSKDIDLSIPSTLDFIELEKLKAKITESIEKTFSAEGYIAFDIKVEEVPKVNIPEIDAFWGGYTIEFKVIKRELHEKYSNDIQKLRVRSISIDDKSTKRFSIQISKNEFCLPKKEWEFENLTIFVYTPEMLLFEKLRAICQQMSEYAEIINANPATSTPRARDFYDIHLIINDFKIDINTAENIDLLKNIFEAKRVPLGLLGKIGEYREFHRSDFGAVANTVRVRKTLEEFDYYFDYVIEIIKPLEALWIK